MTVARLWCVFVTMIGVAATGTAAAQTPPLTPDVPAKFVAPIASNDYVKRDVMIPMRDGVKLFTVIVIPREARQAPMLLTRTPYNAAARVVRSQSTHVRARLPAGR